MAATLKPIKSPYLRNSSIDFDEIWHGDAYWSSEFDKVELIQFPKQTWRSRNLENRKIALKFSGITE